MASTPINCSPQEDWKIMKRLSRFARLVVELVVLLAVYQVGCEIALWLHWPIPGGVIGLALLLLTFASGLLKPSMLQTGAGLLLAEMLLFFIPPLMSLLDYGALVRNDGWRIMLVIACSTLMVMVVTAFTVEVVCRLRDRASGGAA
jgi:holin-like protein